MQDPHCHSSSISIGCAAEAAFEIMSNGLKQGQWALGSMNRREVEPGIFHGQSVFTGKGLYVRLNADRERLLVDYEVGAEPGGDGVPAHVARHPRPHAEDER